MKAIFYEGPVRFSKFYMSDLFGDGLIEIDEQFFDNCVTKFRSQYKLEYLTPNKQKFTDLDSGEYFIRERI